jgi:hypothetical protein
MGIEVAPRIELLDDGVSQGRVRRIDVTGAGATTTVSGDTGTINIPGGGGGGVSDGDKGGVTVSGSGTVWTVDPDAIAAHALAQTRFVHIF